MVCRALLQSLFNRKQKCGNTLVIITIITWHLSKTIRHRCGLKYTLFSTNHYKAELLEICEKHCKEIPRSAIYHFSGKTSETDLSAHPILLPKKYTAVVTLTATLDSPLPSARISTAVPSYTSPNAPLPNNLCKLSLSRGKAGSDSISAWEGRVLQNSNTSHWFIPKNVWNFIKILLQMKNEAGTVCLIRYI